MSGEGAADRGRSGLSPTWFVDTKQHRRLEEACEDARRYGYVLLCVGEAGVGKTFSARRLSSWDLVESPSGRRAHILNPPPEMARRRTAYWCAPPASTPKMVTGEVERARNLLSWMVDLSLTHQGNSLGAEVADDRTELLIVDEAQFLKNTALEQLRYLYDRGNFGLVLMGMPGCDKILERCEQFNSRIGHVHPYRPLEEEAVWGLLQTPIILGTNLKAEAFAEECLSPIMSATQGNFRRIVKLVQRIERILEINNREIANAAVVRKAASQLKPPEE